MFNQTLTDVITAIAICLQVASSMFFSSVISAPESYSHEPRVQFEVTDLAADTATLAGGDEAVAGESGLEPAREASADANDGEADEVLAEQVAVQPADQSPLVEQAVLACDSAGDPDVSGFEELDPLEASEVPEAPEEQEVLGGFQLSCQGGVYAADELRTLGVIYDGDYCYTWYSQRVLPGDGLAIEGRHVSDEGYVVDGDERIVVASSDMPFGTELDVPFGSGKAIVLDTGCASGVIDVYTDF